MLLLAFDTAGPAVTTAVADVAAGVASVLAERTVVDPRRHGELLAPGIADVLDRARVRPGDLGALAVGVGPGPFTGLRVGLVTARAMVAVLDVPLHGMCTLDVLAAASGLATQGGEDFLVAADARRREVYWARYGRATVDGRGPDALDVVRRDGPHVSRPTEVPRSGPVVGHGAELYPDVLGDAVPPSFADAPTLARLTARRLASGGELREPRPLYLRRPDATRPGPRKRVTA